MKHKYLILKIVKYLDDNLDDFLIIIDGIILVICLSIAIINII